MAAAVRRLEPGAETVVANVFDFFSPWLGRTILAAYLKILDVFPGLYGAAYGWGNSSRLALAGRKIISSFLAGRMRRYLDVQKPDAIVVTHATPAGLIAYLAAAGSLDIPTFAVVTDFVVHRLWVYPELDRYFVADEQLRAYLATGPFVPLTGKEYALSSLGELKVNGRPAVGIKAKKKRERALEEE